MGEVKLDRNRDAVRARIEEFLAEGTNLDGARDLLKLALPLIPRNRDMVIVERYEHDVLDAAFKKVQNAKHWKDPIDAFIDEGDRDVVREAITYFTGTTAEFAPVTGTNQLRVRAIGYRMGPCGDH